MEERCPKCGEPLITKTIKKELGLGSIDYPVARVCPKCNWNIDLTGAKDIKPPVTPVIEDVKKVEVKPPEVAKPQVVPAPPRVQPKAQPATGTGGFNKVLTIGLAILVIGGLIWAFFLYPAAPKSLTSASTSSPTPTPAITAITAITATAATPVVTVTQAPEITPTGNKTYITLDRYRIFRGASLYLRTGDEVIWSNEGLDPITVASDDIPGFAEKVLDNSRQTSPYMFKSSGTYTYYLKNNKNVNGTIKVT
jgi:plastocyanin